MIRKLQKIKITVESIKAKLVLIADIANRDCEEAHELEDELYEMVLCSIANDKAEDPKACAKEALKSRCLGFNRWYAQTRAEE